MKPKVAQHPNTPDASGVSTIGCIDGWPSDAIVRYDVAIKLAALAEGRHEYTDVMRLAWDAMEAASEMRDQERYLVARGAMASAAAAYEHEAALRAALSKTR